MNTPTGAIVSAGILVLALAGDARAWQDSGAEDSTQRGIQTAPAGEDTAEEQSSEVLIDRTPVLPPARPPADPDLLQAVQSIHLQRVLIEGRSLIPAEAANAVMEPYLGREVTAEELDRLRRSLSAVYFDRGFVNSGVVLPDQAVGDGVIRFTEVRGRLAEIELQGNRALRDAYWFERLAPIQASPLQINDLQTTLQLIEQHPLVERIEAQLLPLARVGESALSLKVTEAKPWSVEFGLDNHRSPSLGGEQATLFVTHRSLTGRGDALEVFANQADGLGDGGFSYTIPTGWSESRFRAWYSTGDAKIVEAPFDRIDIRTDVTTWGFEIASPILRTPAQSVTVFGGVESQASRSTLLGIPFSFSLGEADGRATSVAAMLGAEWIRRSPGRVLATRLTLRHGYDGLGAESLQAAPPGLRAPDPEFLSLRGQVQYVQQLDWLESELHLRGSFQWASDPLLPVEKMPIGGVDTVRGFRENLLVRDKGFVASAEWRLPLFTAGRAESGFDFRNLVVAGFADYGRSQDQDTGLPSDEAETIYSLGAGLLWQPLPGLRATVYYGKDLSSNDQSGGDLQERGWHLRASYRF